MEVQQPWRCPTMGEVAAAARKVPEALPRTGPDVAEEAEATEPGVEPGMGGGSPRDARPSGGESARVSVDHVQGGGGSEEGTRGANIVKADEAD